MANSIYEEYLAGGELHEKILQKIRELVLSADLDKRGVKIEREPSNIKDDAALHADEYARRMVANPQLMAKITYNVRLSELTDPDNKGFLTDHNHAQGVLGKRPSDVIRGILATSLGKAIRRKKQESRTGFNTAANEINQPPSAQQNLELEINAPIDRTMRLRELNGQNVRPLLDLENCYGITVLELLVAKAFTEELPKPPELRKRVRPRRSRVRAKQMKFTC